MVADEPLSSVVCPSCGSSFSLIDGQSTETLSQEEHRHLAHFQLLDQVGVGHFGAVFKARDTVLDRIVALKIPRRSQLGTSDVEYFLRDARAAAQLQHPNIVSVHEVGRVGETIFIASDFVEGANLHEWLTAKRLTVREAAELVAKLAEAIHHAHERGVIHRDLKPANVLMDSRGEPHVVDFGLAKRETGEITMTLDGQIVGTPAYMSPEQARGKSHEADARSDVYSLGVILFELLTAELPFRGDKRMLILQILQDEPPSPRKLKATIPRDLETICLKCLEKYPARRYATAAELSDDLRHYLRGEAIHARPVRRLARVWRWSKRQPVVAALIAAVILSLLAGTVTSSFFAIRAWEYATTSDAQRQEAERRARLAEAMRLAAQSQQVVKTFAVRSLLLAVEAVETTLRHGEPRVPAAEQALRDALAAVGGNPISAHPVSRLAVSPDSRWLATGGQTTAELWDLRAKDIAAAPIVLRGHEDEISLLAFSPDSRWLATASSDGAARLWDLTAKDRAAAPIVLRLPEGGILSLAFSSDNRWLATASSDKAARLWDLTADDPTAKQIVFRVYEGRISHLTFSSDNRWLAVASVMRTHEEVHVDEPPMVVTVSTEVNSTAWIWDLTAKEPAADPILLRGHEGEISHLAFSSDGRRLLTASRTAADAFEVNVDRRIVSTARLWDLTAEDPAARPIVVVQSQRVCSMLSSDGCWLATGGSDRTAQLWDLRAKDIAAAPIVLRGHEDEISLLAFSPDSRWLATASSDGAARLWDLTAKDRAAAPIVLRLPDGGILSLAFSSDNRWLATASSDKAARLWDLTAKDPAAEPIVIRGHDGSHVVFSSDNRWLVAACTERGARLWDLTATDPAASQVVLRVREGWSPHFAFSPDNHWLVTRTECHSDLSRVDTTAQLWDLTAKNPGTTPIVLRGHAGRISALAFSPDSGWLATASRDDCARLWDLTGNDPAVAPIELRGQTGGLSHLAFSPDNHWFGTGGLGGTIRLWNLNARGPAATPVMLHAAEGNIRNLAFSPQGRWLAIEVWGDQKTARLWDLRTKDPSASCIVLRLDTPPVASCNPCPQGWAFSANDGWIATLATCRTVGLWDFRQELPAMKPIVLRGHEDEITQLAFSSDGDWLATASVDNAVRLWDLTVDDPATSPILLRVPEGGISCLAFSSDSRWLACGNSPVWLWDLAAEDPASTRIAIRGHTGGLSDLAFSPNNRWLATGHTSGRVHLWNLQLSDLMELARRVAGRDLTPDERSEYLLGDDLPRWKSRR